MSTVRNLVKLALTLSLLLLLAVTHNPVKGQKQFAVTTNSGQVRLVQSLKPCTHDFWSAECKMASSKQTSKTSKVLKTLKTESAAAAQALMGKKVKKIKLKARQAATGLGH
ncbi:hypothetical protein IE53DRAFT_412585 [Violaceomyces palustris]|uniref:Uncharacterized protein n=1 Tax=Violaceomyces palustris TaxID=1673888 RepID=A0ACD0NQJ3_9BASI|nr:hypothetical protein IE53DRAFT_412585 [Violaceomyces palustris]